MEPVSKPIRTYALLVCFVSLIAGSVALIVAIYDVIQMSFPQATNTRVQMQIQQVRAQQQVIRLQQQSVNEGVAQVQAGPEANGITNTVAADSYADQFPAASHDYYVNSAMQSFIISMIIIVVCGAIFSLHWRLARI